MVQEVVLAVDPHKASNTLVVLNRQGEELERARFANTAAGHRDMRRFGARWPRRLWAVEGSHGMGRALAQRLVAEGDTVFDVPAKLAARVRVLSVGHGRKTDPDDATSVGIAALHAKGLRPVTPDDAVVALGLLSDRRQELVATRTQAVCRLHRLLAELIPGGARRGLTATKASAMLARVRPRDDAGRTRRQLAADHIADVRAADRRLVELERRIAAAVHAHGTSLTELYGVGPVIAARVLGEVGCVDRFTTRHRFATYTGTAPIEVSSGEVVRHRLSRAGNRRLNHVLHMMAISQIRADTDGRAYYRRKLAEGKTHKEALRCLKRRLSDAVFRQLIVDTQRRTPVDDSAAAEAGQGTAKPRAATTSRPALDGPTLAPATTPKMDAASRSRRLACAPSRSAAPVPS